MEALKSRDWTPARLDEFGRLAGRNPFGDLAAVPEVLNGSFLYELESHGGRALIAVKPVRYVAGTRLEVMGIVSTANRLRAADVGASLDWLASNFGARYMALCTKVPHVSAVAARMGFQQTGTIHLKDTSHGLQ